MTIGLFLFTSLCIGFSFGLLSLFFGAAFFSSSGFGGLLLFFAVVTFAANEYFIRQNHWYRSGSDNALLYSTIICFIGSMVVFTKMDNSMSVYLAFIFSVLIVAVLRYGDPLLALSAFITLLLFFFNITKEAGLSLAVIPISLATVSFTTYFFSKKQKDKTFAVYWSDCFRLLEIAGLVAFYGSLNYYIIQQAAIELDPRFREESLPLGNVFAMLTASIPILYIAFGIQKKDRILWIIGGLCAVVSIATYRYYYSLLPAEWALTLAGGAVLALGLFLMRHFEKPRYGFVYSPELGKNNPIEALVLNQFLQQTHSTGSIQDNPPHFGGGSFDGGGAGSEF